MTTPTRDFLQFVLDASFKQPECWQLDSGLQAHWLAEGVLEIQPVAPAAASRHVLLSCGVHGNETAPIEVISGILRDIASGKLVLKHPLMVIFGNPAAMRAGERYLDYDLNRLFNGAHQRQSDSREAARAALLEQSADAFFAKAQAGAERVHHDLHTAIRGSAFERFAIYPFLHGKPHDRAQLGWLRDGGMGAILLHSKPANTFSYYTSNRHQAHAFTLELGKALPFGQNDLDRFRGIDAALRALLSGNAKPVADFQNGDVPLFEASYDLIKHSEAFRLHLDKNVLNFTLLPDGFVIAEDGDQRYVAQGGQQRILFPNPGVKPGLRAGIVVAPAVLQD